MGQPRCSVSTPIAAETEPKPVHWFRSLAACQPLGTASPRQAPNLQQNEPYLRGETRPVVAGGEAT